MFSTQICPGRKNWAQRLSYLGLVMLTQGGAAQTKSFFLPVDKEKFVFLFVRNEQRSSLAPAAVLSLTQNVRKREGERRMECVRRDNLSRQAKKRRNWCRRARNTSIYLRGRKSTLVALATSGTKFSLKSIQQKYPVSIRSVIINVHILINEGRCLAGVPLLKSRLSCEMTFQLAQTYESAGSRDFNFYRIGKKARLSAYWSRTYVHFINSSYF